MMRKPLKLVLFTLVGLLVLYMPFHFITRTTEAAEKQVAQDLLPDKDYIVKTKNTRKKKDLERRFQGKEVKRTKDSSIQKIKLKTKKELEELRSDPDIEYVEKDLPRKISTPSDSYYNSQNAVIGGQYDQWNLRKIGLLPTENPSSAWTDSIGSSKTIIAILDTGIDTTHPDLAANLLQNSGEINGDGIDNDSDGCIDNVIGRNFAVEPSHPCKNVEDVDGHGTHVAGIAAAVSNNATGVAGVCWNCKIMPLRVVYSDGFGYDSGIAAAIHYAVDYKVALDAATSDPAEKPKMVINMSLGGPGYTQTLQDAIDYAWERDVLVVSAAGNYIDTSNSFPGAAMHSISVGATDYNDTRTNFSYAGPRPDIMAPGERVLSTFPQSIDIDARCLSVTGDYYCLPGTSMSSPHVAGVAALLFDLHRQDETPWTAKDVRWALLNNTDELYTAGFDVNSGFGRLNAKEALSSSTPLASDVTPPLSVLSEPEESVVRGTVALEGTASDANLYLYTVSISQNGYIQYLKFGRNNVADGTLINIDTTSLSNGIYTLQMITEDFAGHTTSSNTIEIIVDNWDITSPKGTQWINTAKPTFAWTPIEAFTTPTYDVYVDSVLIAEDLTTTSFTPSSNLTQGIHTWYVVANNSEDSRTATTNTGIFGIDTLPPANFSVNVTVSGPTPIFSFFATDSSNGSGIAGYELSVDGGAYTAATSPHTYSALPDGNHSVTVRAIDKMQHTTTSTATFTINYRIPYLRSKADFSADGKVDLSDLSILAQNWQQNTSAGDANADGKVDLSDLSVLAQNWQQNF